MGISKDPSIILLTQVIHAQHREEIYEYILSGSRKIDHTLAFAESKGCCQVIREGVSPTRSLVEILQKHIDSHVSVIHVSGTPQHINPAEISAIANILSRFPYLRVIFLEGCGNLAFIKSLLLKDVPVVISSPFQLPESEGGKSLAEAFYYQLGKGDSLKEAFDEAAVSFGEMQQYPATYNFDHDCLEWEQLKDQEIGDNLPGGMYFLQDHRHQLNWRMPHSERLVSYVEPEEALPEPPAKSSRLATVSLSAAVGLLLVAAVFFLNNTWNNNRIFEKECHYSEDSLGMNTVFLPIYSREDGKVAENDYTDHLFEEVQQANRILGLNAHILELERESDVYRAIDRWVLECNTDLLVWGEWEPAEDSLSFLTLNFVMPGMGRDSLIQNKSKVDMSTAISDPGKAPALIRDLVYNILGEGYMEMGRYEEAVKMFTKMEFADNALTAEMALNLAQAYGKEEDWDSAGHYYEHAILLTPENPAAYHGLGGILVREQKYEEALENYWMATQLSPDFLQAIYNMGLVYFRLDQFAEAQEAMESVLELDPRNARAKGILSAIYAKQENEELFYHYLEAALQEGLNIQGLTTYTDVGSYQAEKRFRNLVDKY